MITKIFNAKTFLFISLGIILLGLAIIWGIGFYFDFDQVYSINNNVKMDNQRVLNPGIARNYDYEIAVIGTSTSENILAADMQKAFDTAKKGVNLAISGETAYEGYLMLDTILDAKKAKHVVFGLDHFSFVYPWGATRVALQKYHWTKSAFLRPLALFSTSTITNLWKKERFMTYPNPSLGEDWISEHGFWGNADLIYSAERCVSFDLAGPGIQNLEHMAALHDTGFTLENFRSHFDRFYNLIEKNPETEFTIYFPPLSIFWWYCVYKEEKLEIVLDFKKYIAQKSDLLPNIRLIDLQLTASGIDFDLDRYKDMTHYDAAVSKETIYDIASDKYRVFIDSYDAVLAEQRNLVLQNVDTYRHLAPTIDKAVAENPNIGN